MESCKSDADNLTFNGALSAATNSEHVPSEHVPLGNGIGVTGIKISADSESVTSDSVRPLVHDLNVPDVVLADEVNVEPDDVPDDEVNVHPDVVLDDAVNIEQDVLDDEVNVELDVGVEFVVNDMLGYLHCSCGRKRDVAEAIAEYLFSHSHQGESCFCQVFSGISILSDALSSHYVAAQSIMMTGIRTTCTHSLISTNAGNGENTADVVASSTQLMVPDNEGQQEEDEDDEQNQIASKNETLLELLGFRRNTYAGLRAKAFYLSIKLHKYEASSTYLESNEHCCICLEDYCNGEELGKIDCGHVYHVDCIKDWIMIQNSCPICKREELACLL